MNEKRKFSRWHPIMSVKSDITCAGEQHEVDVLDISAVGMRIFLEKPTAVGTKLAGKLEIPYSLSRFYVEGKITRIRESGDVWEAAVRFDRIVACPHKEENNYLVN
jgi:hypothetical protein